MLLRPEYWLLYVTTFKQTGTLRYEEGLCSTGRHVVSCTPCPMARLPPRSSRISMVSKANKCHLKCWRCEQYHASRVQAGSQCYKKFLTSHGFNTPQSRSTIQVKSKNMARIGLHLDQSKNKILVKGLRLSYGDVDQDTQSTSQHSDKISKPRTRSIPNLQ